MNIKVLPPEINESWRNFSVIPEKNQIRFGLLAIKNVGQNLVEAVVRERKLNGPFKSLEDFLLRINSRDLNKKSLESLIKAGVFDKFGERKQLLLNIERLLEFNRNHQKLKTNGQRMLFGQGGSNLLESKICLEKTQPATRWEKVFWEKELLGLFVSSHPLEDFKKIFEKKIVKIADLKENLFNQPIKIAGIISKIKRIITKNGAPMLFMNLEDLTSKIEVIVFPNAIQKKPNLFEENKIVLISGRVSNRDGVPKIICEEIEEIVEET
jgi:DNA polymerase-3 subunit alpha